MEERRKFGRWDEPTVKSAVSFADLQQDIEVLDMSAGGIRVSCSQPLAIGTVVYGELRIIPQVKPFFIMGKVTRLDQKGDVFEAAIKFDKVSTIKIAC